MFIVIQMILWYSFQFTALARDLPLNIHLLTLQSLGSGNYLLRLEHQFEIDEAPWNEAVNVSLAVSPVAHTVTVERS